MRKRALRRVVPGPWPSIEQWQIDLVKAKDVATRLVREGAAANDPRVDAWAEHAAGLGGRVTLVALRLLALAQEGEEDDADKDRHEAALSLLVVLIQKAPRLWPSILPILVALLQDEHWLWIRILVALTLTTCPDRPRAREALEAITPSDDLLYPYARWAVKVLARREAEAPAGPTTITVQ